jgi:hypothetical protein
MVTRLVGSNTWAVVRPYVSLIVIAWILFGYVAAVSGQLIVRIDSSFRLEEFERADDGYEVTIRNESNNAFSDFLVVILGTDISDVTVYRREFPVDFMEGKSERTFFIPGYDERIFEVKMRILAPDYEALLR